MTGRVTKAMRAFAREMLFGPKNDGRDHIRRMAAQLRAELAAKDTSEINDYLDYLRFKATREECEVAVESALSVEGEGRAG